MATQIHNIAESTTDVERRLSEVEHIQTVLDTHKLKSSQQRYLILLECFAWDLYETLLYYQESLFVMEPSFKRQRPSVELATQCVHCAIAEDIQNIALKQILSQMMLASTQRDKKKYNELAVQLESLGQTLSGAEKEEFDSYRMILGPQLISVPH